MVNRSDGSVNHSVVEIQPAAVGGWLGFGGAMTADGEGDDNGTNGAPVNLGTFNGGVETRMGMQAEEP